MSSQGPVGILWDIEICPVPCDVRPEDVAGNIRTALRVHPVIEGAVTMFSAYGDFNSFSRRLREGCQRTGVKLVDVPNGRKEAADKAILVDMFLFALDNPPPSSIMLISGDVDFAPALHVLGQRGYSVILVIPPGVCVSSALCSAGRFVWDWSSVAHGEGFVPSTKSFVAPCGGQTDSGGFTVGCHIGENNEIDGEEAIVYRGMSQRHQNIGNFQMVSQFEYNSYTATGSPVFTAALRSHSVPCSMNEVITGRTAAHSAIVPYNVNRCVPQGDINGLKGQLVQLLEFSRGCLLLARVPAEYQKLFGDPLYISEYGAYKLVNLLKKMSDMISVEGRGQKKFVYLRNFKAGPSAPLLPLGYENNGKGVEEGKMEADVVCGSSSADEKVVVEDRKETRVKKSDSIMAAQFGTEGESLVQFKHELQEILVSYSCRVFLNSFEAIYEQRYKKPLNCKRFGVNDMDELFEKVRDVVVLDEEPLTKKKFLAAALG